VLSAVRIPVLGSWLTIIALTLTFFVSVASKGVSFPVSLLDAILARRLGSVASKGFARGRKEKREERGDGVDKTLLGSFVS
jgi:hypothetical protein